MQSTSLDDFMALNDQLTALVRANVPTGLDLGANGDQAAATLEKVNAAVARRVSRGESLADAIGDEAAAPVAYRSVMQAGWRSGNVQQALVNSSQLAAAAEESRYRSRAAFFYPVLVALLAIAGIAGFCIYVAPTLAGLYHEFRISESSTLRFIEWLRTALPWLLLLGLLALLVLTLVTLVRQRSVGGSRAAQRGWLARVTGSSSAQFHRRCASCCEQLIALTEAQTPLAESLTLAAEACGDPQLQTAAHAYAVASVQRNVAAEERAIERFPPFLRWALWQADESIDRPAALRVAAQVYRETADRRAERRRIALPLVACAFVGGGATLLYGLVVFLPITEMLQALAG